MNRWYRVFGSATPCDPAELAVDFGATCRVEADADGWYRAELVLANGLAIAIDRYGVNEEGIRAELNAWAGWVETRGDEDWHLRLMERLIRTEQLFILVAETADAEGPTEAVCRAVAARTGGAYQIDERGIFDSDGRLQVSE